MTTEGIGVTLGKRGLARDLLRAICALVLAGCPLPPPPAPQPIECEELDRAEERFPDECGDGGAEQDGAPSDGEL